MFDINPAEFLVILVVAMVFIGPERLPEYTNNVKAWARKARGLVSQAEHSVKKEAGSAVDWAALDPRQYDPRRIVREALFDDSATPPARYTTSPVGPATGRAVPPSTVAAGNGGFDGDAT